MKLLHSKNYIQLSNIKTLLSSLDTVIVIVLTKIQNRGTPRWTWLSGVPNFTRRLGDVPLTRGRTWKKKDSDMEEIERHMLVAVCWVCEQVMYDRHVEGFNRTCIYISWARVLIFICRSCCSLVDNSRLIDNNREIMLEISIWIIHKGRR